MHPCLNTVSYKLLLHLPNNDRTLEHFNSFNLPPAFGTIVGMNFNSTCNLTPQDMTIIIILYSW